MFYFSLLCRHTHIQNLCLLVSFFLSLCLFFFPHSLLHRASWVRYSTRNTHKQLPIPRYKTEPWISWRILSFSLVIFFLFFLSYCICMQLEKIEWRKSAYDLVSISFIHMKLLSSQPFSILSSYSMYDTCMSY